MRFVFRALLASFAAAAALAVPCSAQQAPRGTDPVSQRFGARSIAPLPGGFTRSLLIGRVARAADGVPVPGARVTLFLSDLAAFHERRTDADGRFVFSVMNPGSYRLGVAKPGFDYVERAMALPAGFVTSATFDLAPESHGGVWAVIGDTAPEVFDATDIGVLRPDGTLLYCHDTSSPIVFDPSTGLKTLPSGSGSEQGCMNGTLLSDGSVLLAGGQTDASPGSFRNAVSWVKGFLPDQTWVGLPDMLAPDGRWYPGLARLGDGRLLVMGGGTAPAAVRTASCEIYDPLTGTWSLTDSMGSAVEFPPCALLYDGLVLRTWGTSPELFDPATGGWTATSAFNFPDRRFPGHSDHSLLVLTDGRAAAVGIRTLDQPAASMVEYFEPATETWTAGSSPDLRRMQSEVVYLPDGKVLVQGGDQETTLGPEPNVLGIVRRCDLLDPLADTWRRVTDTPEFREYHAVTLLIPDGRVVGLSKIARVVFAMFSRSLYVASSPRAARRSSSRSDPRPRISMPTARRTCFAACDLGSPTPRTRAPCVARPWASTCFPVRR